MKRKKTIFWDVDTQFDFMKPQGTLYVPGAEEIIDKVGAARRFALENGFSILSDVDWHRLDNPEISLQPDMKTTFPPHAMAGTPGAERVGDLGDVPIDYTEIDEVDMAQLRQLVQKDQFHIVIRKQSLNVFDNPNTHKLVDLIRPEHVIAFGVALDCCVYYVLTELSKHKGVKLSLLTDATKGLHTRPDEEVYDELRRRGVEITTFDQIKQQLTVVHAESTED
ncbi:MAG: isochorismatase family protein [Planctomycetes bacterium]|nr:isochorismatase family protein [Planctomycetota bacterium]